MPNLFIMLTIMLCIKTVIVYHLSGTFFIHVCKESLFDLNWIHISIYPNF